jgi:3-phosphoshikimate 1-carboxyvinyltransferase
MIKRVRSPHNIELTLTPPGDKSISHRAALLNSVSHGTSHVSNFCVGDDRTSMLGCLRGLGATISEHSNCDVTRSSECFEIVGKGFEGLKEPTDVLYAGNSGTTMRLISGLLAGLDFYSVITGDESLRNRPMRRITAPLKSMGAVIDGREHGSLAPLVFRGGSLEGITYEMPVASAQLKSCILIAGMLAKGETTVIQPAESRDHTERMLRSMGANLDTNGLSITTQKSELNSIDVRVPCDTSSSAFWLVAGCCHPNAKINLQNVGMNPTRTGVLEVLENMGANIDVENERIEGGEPVADLIASSSDLQAVEISGDLIPRVIDELPILSLAACFAKGTTTIRDAQELRVKESDRIACTVASLSKLGANIEEISDGMKIKGGNQLQGANILSHGDHRIAMTNAIAGLVASGETIIGDAEAASVSYPTFWDSIDRIQG